MWKKFYSKFRSCKRAVGLKLNKIQQPVKILMVIATGTTIAILGLGANGIFQFVEWEIQTQLLRLRPSEPKDERIVIVTIDETDIEQNRQWPMSDATLADLIENIKSQQPRLIGLDLYRNIPVEPGHQRLTEVLSQSPNLITIEKVAGEKIGPPPSLNMEQTAISDFLLDSDGKIRRALLTGYDNDKLKYSLGLKLTLEYLKAEGIEPITKGKVTHLGKTALSPLRPKWGSYSSPDMGGYQILLNYRGDHHIFHSIPMRDVLANRIPSNLMRDRIVLIGLTAHSLKDFFPTPYSKRWMSGVVIHANVTSQLISAALEDRVAWRQPYRLQLSLSSQQFDWLWIFSWSGGCTIICWVLLQKNRYPLLFIETLSCIVGGGFLLFGSSYLVFINGWIIPVFSPFLALCISAILTANYNYIWKLYSANQQLEIKVKERTAELESARKAAEAASRAKSKFLANMTHELRTPLNAILGYTQILKSDYQIPEQPKDKVQIIYKCSNHLLTLINDILDFSKTEAQKLELHPIKIELHTFLTDVVEMCQIKAKRKSLAFTYISNKLPEMIWVDGKRLRQVLLNLLGNALKFTKNGSVTLTVTGNTLDCNTQTLNFEVKDTGIGIPHHQLSTIFLPFEQGNNKVNNQGVGLGLSISQEIVNKMGGKLQVESIPDRGSTFSFRINVPSCILNTPPPSLPEVRFDPAAVVTPGCPTLTPAEIRQIHEALIIGDLGEIKEIVLSLRQSSPSFANHLLVLLKNFKLDEIKKLIEEQR